MTDLQPQAEKSAAGALRIYGIVLSVGVVCALSIVTVYEVTRPIIERNRIALRERAILEVLPAASQVAAFGWDEARGMFSRTTDDENRDVVFVGFDDEGAFIGVAIESRGMGYQDAIDLLYGYSPAAQSVIGIAVLQSRETPGLGDRIEKDTAFLSNFQSLDVRLNAQGSELANPIAFVKPGQKTESWQVDGITGATISSRAVAETVGDSAARWIPRVHQRQGDFTRSHLSLRERSGSKARVRASASLTRPLPRPTSPRGRGDFRESYFAERNTTLGGR